MAKLGDRKCICSQQSQYLCSVLVHLQSGGAKGISIVIGIGESFRPWKPSGERRIGGADAVD